MTAEISREQMIARIDKWIVDMKSSERIKWDSNHLENAKYMEAIRAELSGMQWQDISTAPKDGSWVQLYGPLKIWMPEAKIRAYGWWSEKAKSWFASYAVDDEATSKHMHPTHWMPLPTSPVPGSGNNTGDER